MGHIKKIITLAGLLLLILGCAGLAGTLIFLVQLTLNPSNIPIVAAITSKVQPGETMTAIFRNTPLSIKISSSLKDIITAAMGMLMAATAASAFKASIDAGISMLKLTKKDNESIGDGKPINVTPKHTPDTMKALQKTSETAITIHQRYLTLWTKLKNKTSNHVSHITTTHENTPQRPYDNSITTHNALKGNSPRTTITFEPTIPNTIREAIKQLRAKWRQSHGGWS